MCLRPIAALALVFLLAACGRSSPVNGSSNSNAADSAVIKVLSNRADLISGDDALIDVIPPAGVNSKSVTMALNGHDVTQQFKLTPQGTLRGLVTGLALGRNTFTAHLPGRDATATLINHPNGGPVISGPQLQPWTCQQGAADSQCNQPTVFTWVYKSTDPTKSGFQTYDPAHPPANVATTTTDQGVTVPFIVRQEMGYQDRDQYAIAVLYQPGKSWTVAEPQPQFNHKLVITHGASCDVSYTTSTAPDIMLEDALGKGFAVMSTALDNSGHNCNVAIQAESLIMAKEHLIESYGTLRYTIGTGCSGGSLAQQWIANAYPGIYQGILPTCSFPDAWTPALQVADYALLERYFLNNPLSLLPTQLAAVEGNLLPLDAFISVGCLTTSPPYFCPTGYFAAAIPTHACPGVSDAQRYDPKTNPGGVRCSIADLNINLLAPRAPEVWSANEKMLGRGFAGLPIDNVGVQYGLGALQNSMITADQFIDLNAKIGGADIDINPTPNRLVADRPALANAYRTGLINETNNLNQTAIIDCRGPDPGLAHDAFRAFAIRARLDREHGSHANQLIWEGAYPISGDQNCEKNSRNAMDRWLAEVEKDTSDLPLAQKIVADRPADLGDQCWDGLGNKLSDGLCSPLIVPVYGTARMVAGDDITTDNNKCQLKPLDRSDNYGLIPLSDAQWAQLQKIFPDGVCDFSKPGAGQQPTIPWQTYQDSVGRVIFGGTALPSASANSAAGWASPAFLVFAP